MSEKEIELSTSNTKWPKLILLYLLGNREAIQKVAHDRNSIYVGFLLVLSAGIAREYDQTLFPEDPFRFFSPLYLY